MKPEDVEAEEICQYWIMFRGKLKEHVKGSLSEKTVDRSLLLFAGGTRSHSMHILAEQYDIDSKAFENMIEFIEETCLSNLIFMYEKFKYHIVANTGIDVASALLKVLSEIGDNAKPSKEDDMNNDVEVDEESKGCEEVVDVADIGEKSYLEEMSSLPVDLVSAVKQEMDNCSSHQRRPCENEDVDGIHTEAPEVKMSSDPLSSPKYHCHVCYLPFHKLHTLRVHKERKHKIGNDAKFKCQLCGNVFYTLPSLTTHVRRIHPDKRKNLCQYCGKYFENSVKCRKHIKWHLEQRKKKDVTQTVQDKEDKEKLAFHCQLCGHNFALVGRLKNHIIRNHYDDMDKMCLHCGKHFENQAECHAHICLHLNRGIKRKRKSCSRKKSQSKKSVEYRCGLCDLMFGRRDALQAHIIESHITEKDLMCGHCGKHFASVEECRKHVHDHYNDRRKSQAVCNSISQQGSREESVDIVKQSTEEQPQQEIDPMKNSNTELFCHLCSRRFYTLCSLQRHILRNHHDEKDRLCRYCGQFFNDAEECSNHVSLHIAQNRKSRQVFKQPVGLVNGKYSCQLCGRVFRLAATLRCHRLRAHPLEKERLCPRCGKYFDTEEACNKHRRLHVEKNVMGKNKARSLSNIIAGPKLIKCHLCNETFYVRGGIGNHIQRKHSAERHCLCRYCGKYFQTPDECRTHVRLHVIERRQVRDSYHEKTQVPSQITVLAKKQNGPGLENGSQESNLEENKFVKCQACGKEYKLLSSFRRHINQYHPGIQDRLCHHCGLVLEDSAACRDHVETAHSQLSRHASGDTEDDEDSGHMGLPAEDHSRREVLRSVSMLSKDAKSGIPEGYMKCGLCPSILGSRSSMRDHIKSIHSKFQEHMCACCGKFFEDPVDCQDHQQPTKKSLTCDGDSNIPPGYIKCGMCTSVLGSRKSMRDHIRSLHFKDKDHMCTCCGKYFPNPADRDQHQKPNVNLACDFCPRTFKTQFARDGHMKRHVNQRDFQCDICGNCYFDKKGLNAHRERHEASAKAMFQCSECQKILSSRKNLEIHMRIHNNERPFICEICGKGFTLVSTLKIHRNIHTGLKPFECHVCGKKARTKGDLGRHMSLHSDKKEFSCEICGKSYRFQTGLNQHRAVHSPLRPHVCKQCGCTYKTSNDLRKHMKTHKPGAKTKGTTVPRVPVANASHQEMAELPLHTQNIYSGVATSMPQQPQQQPSLVPQPHSAPVVRDVNPIHPHSTVPQATLTPHPNSENMSAVLPQHRANSSYSSEELAVVMALQVLDDMSGVEQGIYGPAQQNIRRYDANMPNYPPPHGIRRFDGDVANYPGSSSFRRYDGTAPNYP